MDMERLHTSRLAQQLDDLEDALAWMVSIGVEVDPGRMAAYRKIVEKWEDAVDGRGKLGVRELHPVIATYGYEVAALLAVHHVFGDLPPAALAGLVTQLSDATRGPIRIEGARIPGPDPARAALFRAVSAAYVQQMATDGKVMLDDAGNIGLRHGRHHVSVVAGRPDAQGGIEAGLQDTSAQLVRVLDGRRGARQRGLITLDASTLIKPAAPLLQAGSQQEMATVADGLLAHFVNERMERLQACLRPMDQRIIGLMTLFSTVAMADDGRDFFHVGRWVLVWRDQLGFADSELLGQMRGALRGEA